MKYLLISSFLLINSYFGMVWSPYCALLWLVPLMLPVRLGPNGSFGKAFKEWGFTAGFFWGLIVFGISWSWLFSMLIAQGAGLRGALVCILCVCWFALWSGIWLSMTRYSWLLSTALFFLILTRWSLLPCGALEGYPLSNPLVPLAALPGALSCIFWIGELASFLLIVCFSWWLARAVQTGKIWYGLWSLVFLAPFAVGICIYKQPKLLIDGVTFLKPWWYGTQSPMFAGYRMAHDILMTVTHDPAIHTILMPESTFCWDMQEYGHFIPIWCDGVDRVTIIFGAHRRSSNNSQICMNSTFVVREGRLLHVYDKQHRMPFVERIPDFFDRIGLGRLFIKDQVPELFDYGIKQLCNDDYIMMNEQRYQIFMCSEFFCEAKSVKGDPILLLFNESWLYFEWVKNLALLYIEYFSMKYHVAVLYVSTQGRHNIE